MTDERKIVSYCFFLPKKMCEIRKGWDQQYQDINRYWYNLPCVLACDRLFYADYIKRFYVTENVLHHELGELLKKASELPDIEVELIDSDYNYRELIAHRFKPLWEGWDIVLIRDIDSVVSVSEWKCKNAFESYTDARVYSARSHNAHFGLMGGLCGFRPKTIKDKLSDNLESFINRYGVGLARNIQDFDQRLLNKAFCTDHAFTKDYYYDMPVDNAHVFPKNCANRYKFPCRRVGKEDPRKGSLEGSLLEVAEIIKRYIADNWAGKPVDCRGALTKEILEYDDEIRSIVSSSQTLSSFYT